MLLLKTLVKCNLAANDDIRCISARCNPENDKIKRESFAINPRNQLSMKSETNARDIDKIKNPNLSFSASLRFSFREMEVFT